MPEITSDFCAIKRREVIPSPVVHNQQVPVLVPHLGVLEVFRLPRRKLPPGRIPLRGGNGIIFLPFIRYRRKWHTIRLDKTVFISYTSNIATAEKIHGRTGAHASKNRCGSFFVQKQHIAAFDEIQRSLGCGLCF